MEGVPGIQQREEPYGVGAEEEVVRERVTSAVDTRGKGPVSTPNLKSIMGLKGARKGQTRVRRHGEGVC